MSDLRYNRGVIKSVEGTYRDGRVELLEKVDEPGPRRVIVTFLPDARPVELGQRGISPEQARDLRARLNAFADDWDRADMDAYDTL
jgi:hypothetical protein